jgi:hypothetical protein
MTLDQDAPERSRSLVTFRGGKTGILIAADKAGDDASTFRFVADLIAKGSFSGSANKANADRAMGALRSLADQFDAVAAGEEPQAK